MQSPGLGGQVTGSTLVIKVQAAFGACDRCYQPEIPTNNPGVACRIILYKMSSH